MTSPLLNTPYAVICDAYFNAGYTEAGQDVDSEQLATGMRRLNNLMNLRQAEGLRLWLQSDVSIGAEAGSLAPLVQGVNLYTFGSSGSVVTTRPTRIIEGYYRDSNFIDRPLLQISRNEWDTLSLKKGGQVAQEGTINQFFIDKQIATMNLYLWLAPDAVAAQGSVHVILQQQQPNVVGLNDTLQFGPEWFLYLGWHLGWELSQGQPIAVQNKCEKHMMMYKDIIDGWDVEDASTLFQPDSRQQYVGNRFR
jgi:hypothetical protein